MLQQNVSVVAEKYLGVSGKVITGMGKREGN